MPSLGNSADASVALPDHQINEINLLSADPAAPRDTLSSTSTIASPLSKGTRLSNLRSDRKPASSRSGRVPKSAVGILGTKKLPLVTGGTSKLLTAALKKSVNNKSDTTNNEQMDINPLDDLPANVQPDAVPSSATVLPSSSIDLNFQLPEWACQFQKMLLDHQTELSSQRGRLFEIERLTGELLRLQHELKSSQDALSSAQQEILVLRSALQKANSGVVPGVVPGVVSGVVPGVVSGVNSSVSSTEFPSLANTSRISTNVNPNLVSDVDSEMRDQLTGSAASKYASQPPTQSVVSSISAAVTAASPSFAEVAAQPTKATVNVRRKKLSASQTKALVRRTFVVPSADDVEGFRYVYFPNRHKEALSSMRAKLTKLRINNWRVLDIHYPAPHVIAFLIHNDYYSALVELFGKVDVRPIEDFDPYSVSNIEDAAIADLPDVERSVRIAEIQKDRLLRALGYLTKTITRKDNSTFSRSVVANAVAKNFCEQSWISEAEYRHFVKFRTFSEVENNDAGAVNAPADEDAEMDDLRRSFQMPDTPTAEEPLADAGESVMSD